MSVCKDISGSKLVTCGQGGKQELSGSNSLVWGGYLAKGSSVSLWGIHFSPAITLV